MQRGKVWTGFDGACWVLRPFSAAVTTLLESHASLVAQTVIDASKIALTESVTLAPWCL